VTGKRLFEAADAKKLTNSRVTFRAKAEVAHLSLRADLAMSTTILSGSPFKARRGSARGTRGNHVAKF